MDPAEYLPIELFLYIASEYLSEDLLLVSKRWYLLLSTDSLWMRKLEIIKRGPFNAISSALSGQPHITRLVKNIIWKIPLIKWIVPNAIISSEKDISSQLRTAKMVQCHYIPLFLKSIQKNKDPSFDPLINCQIWQLELASYYGHLDILKTISLLSNLDIQFHGTHALRLSSFNGHLDCVKFLVSLHVNVSAYNNAAIRSAAVKGNLGIIKFLNKNGANLRAENEDVLRTGISKYFETFNNVYSFLLWSFGTC